MTESAAKPKRFLDFIPSEWTAGKDNIILFISAYRTLRADDGEFSELKPFQLFGTVAVPVSGVVSYLSLGDVRINYHDNGSVDLQIGEPRQTSTPKGSYFILITLLGADNHLEEHMARERVRSCVGYLFSLFGKNIAFSQIFENLEHVAVEKAEVLTPAFENPMFTDAIDLSYEKRIGLYAADHKTNNLSNDMRGRLALACRWFDDATRSVGIDSFLKCWFAIETLTMPNTTNIHPLNEMLGQAYNISRSEASDRFKTGLLFGLRSDIVHNGRILPIDAILMRYMDGIFRDVVIEIIGLPRERRSEVVMNTPGFNLRSLLCLGS